MTFSLGSKPKLVKRMSFSGAFRSKCLQRISEGEPVDEVARSECVKLKTLRNWIAKHNSGCRWCKKRGRPPNNEQHERAVHFFDSMHFSVNETGELATTMSNRLMLAQAKESHGLDMAQTTFNAALKAYLAAKSLPQPPKPYKPPARAHRTSVRTHGKCIIAGGYTVLTPGHKAVCIAMSTSVRATIDQTPGEVTSSVTSERLGTRVTCPVRLTSVPRPADGVNPYLHYSLVLPIWFTEGALPACSITIQADDAFYTSTGKSGLGSSSAVVTAVVSGLLALLRPAPTRAMVFAVAHAAHSLAQNKVGSGVDVATALAGSLVFTGLPNHGQYEWTNPAITQDGLRNSIRAVANDPAVDWPAVEVPESLVMMMAIPATSSGTSTGAMIGQFHDLAAVHPAIVKRFMAATDAFTAAVAGYFHGRIALQPLREAQARLVASQREASSRLVRPILPRAVDRMLGQLDAQMGEDVLFCGVPGAGGNDAVYIVTRLSCTVDLVARLVDLGWTPVQDVTNLVV